MKTKDRDEEEYFMTKKEEILMQDYDGKNMPIKFSVYKSIFESDRYNRTNDFEDKFLNYFRKEI